MLPAIPIIGWAGAAVATAALSYFVKQHLKALDELEAHKINEELRKTKCKEFKEMYETYKKGKMPTNVKEQFEKVMDDRLKECL
jgi:predicted nucleotidyltransferase